MAGFPGNLNKLTAPRSAPDTARELGGIVIGSLIKGLRTRAVSSIPLGTLNYLPECASGQSALNRPLPACSPPFPW